MNQRITLSDVAARARLSKSTVGYILRGRGADVGIQEKTQEKVRAIAEEMGYRPNTSARAMRRGRFDAVSLFYRIGEGFEPGPWFNALSDHLEQRNLRFLITAMRPSDSLNLKRLPSILRDQSIDGLLLDFYPEDYEQVQQALSKQRIPAIWLNRHAGFDCVFPDDYGGAKMLVEEVIRRGHQRIAYVDSGGSERQHFASRDRQRGYIDAMKDAGLEPVVQKLPRWTGQFPAYSSRAAQEQCEAFLRSVNRPTVAITYNVGSAGAVAVGAFRAGLNPPKDLIITPFHYTTNSQLGDVVTVHQIPVRPIAHQAATQLIKKIDQPDAQLPGIAVPYRLDGFIQRLER